MYFIKGLKGLTLYEHFPLVHWHLSVSALVNCLKEPLSEPPELLSCCLTLLPQSGVLLSETPNLCLQLTCDREMELRKF